MILADMATHVVETLGSPDADSLAQAKKLWMRQNAQAVIAEHQKLVRQQEGR